MTPVAAGASVDTPPATTQSEPSVSITISPAHFYIGMVELTGELRIADRFGVAVIAGAGRYHEMGIPVSLFEGGVSPRYYVLGSFRTGLELGVEAAYVYASTDAMNIDVRAAGLAVGPYVGGKWTHHSGITLEGQLGAAYMAVNGNADTGSSTKERAVLPLLNLQLGYSF